jgi:hypothetical protein
MLERPWLLIALLSTLLAASAPLALAGGPSAPTPPAYPQHAAPPPTAFPTAPPSQPPSPPSAPPSTWGSHPAPPPAVPPNPSERPPPTPVPVDPYAKENAAFERAMERWLRNTERD